MEMSCRMCAGIADPGVCLLDPAHQRLAVCAQNNLNITISADNGYPTRICTSCAEGLRRWMMFRERNEKAHGEFLKILEPPSNVTVAPSMPQSRGEASPDTCSVRTEQTARQPSQATEDIKPVTRPTLLDKWLRPSQTPKLPVVSKTSTNRAVGTNDSQECLAAKFCLKDLQVCVTRLSGEILASLQQAKTGQKKVGCSLPQATENAKVTSTRSVGDATQRTSSCGQDSSSVARKAVCGDLPDEDRDTRADVQSTARPGLLLARHKTPRRSPGDKEDGRDRAKSREPDDRDKDGDTRADVQSTARPGLLLARHKTPRRSPGDEEDVRDRAKSREPDDRDKGSRQRSGVGAEISLPKLNFKQDDEKKFSCGYCTKVYKWKFDLVCHIRNKHKSIPGHYKCKVCGAVFKFWKELTAHKKSSHSLSDLKTISCDQCDQKFKFRSYLQTHIERCHNDGLRPYKCTLCDGSYKTKGDLVKHKKYYHGDKTYCCKVCNKRFKYPGVLKEHIERVHNNGLRPYKCDLCGATMKTNQDLHRHFKLIHSDIKKHICPFCEKKI